jgi:hypothetical protein
LILSLQICKIEEGVRNLSVLYEKTAFNITTNLLSLRSSGSFHVANTIAIAEDVSSIGITHIFLLKDLLKMEYYYLYKQWLYKEVVKRMIHKLLG